MADKAPPPMAHMAAGALGGLCGACITAPFDLVKTRLQSSLFVNEAAHVQRGFVGTIWVHVSNVGYMFQRIVQEEGRGALFKGLGPSLIGVIPARSTSFFTYGNGKAIYADLFHLSPHDSRVHMASATTAGFVTSIVTNPLWVVKTRMQLDAHATGRRPRALALVGNIFRNEGIPGFFKGITASFVGVSESTIQFVVYERLKRLMSANDSDKPSLAVTSASVSFAKVLATVITYPHEVVRTRMRQPVSDGGKPKYSGLINTATLIYREEGWRVFYSGLAPHILRVVPNAITLFSVYELVISLWGGDR